MVETNQFGMPLAEKPAQNHGEEYVDWMFTQDTQSWAPILSFTKTLHSKPEGETDPTQVKLPSPFVVCVVGASKGIGAGIAYSFAKAGTGTLILAGRNVASMEGVAGECRSLNASGKVEVQQTDLDKPETIAKLAEYIKATYGRLDVVIANGGVLNSVVGGEALDIDVAGVAATMNTSYVGTYALARYLLPIQQTTPDPSPRAFIIVSSVATTMQTPWYGSLDYQIAKVALTKLAELLDYHYGPKGTRIGRVGRGDGRELRKPVFVTSIHPGGVLTELATKLSDEESKTDEERLIGQKFNAFLGDSAELCGGFLVWLTKQNDRADWLSGRFLCCGWDVKELEARKFEIVEKNLLRNFLAT